MLLPIGHDQNTVRRMPWVSLSIIGLCVAVFVLTLVAPGSERAVAEAEIRAVEYALDHPYLELDPRLEGYVYFSLRQVEREEVSPPERNEELAREQDALDELVASYFAARNRLPFWRWGLVPAEFQASALVTHIFIHAGILHLLGNLFIFYLVGPALEDVWGRPLFIGFYFLAGAVAALVFVIRYPNLAEPLIGASGAIAGVMGAFAVRFWDSRITFAYFVWMVRIYRGTFEAPAGLMLGLWALGELAFAMGLWAYFSVADLGDVGFLAHVGGFVFGVVFAYLVRVFDFEERFVDPAVERHEIVHEAATVDDAMELARVGRIPEAMARLEGALRRTPHDADAAAALWNIAVAAEEPARAVPGLVPALAAAARAGDVGLPAQCWAEMIRRVPTTHVDPRLVTRLAELLAREGLDGDVEATLDWMANRVDASTPDGLLVRLARLADQLSVTAPFAVLALDHADLSPEFRAELQSFKGRSA